MLFHCDATIAFPSNCKKQPCLWQAETRVASAAETLEVHFVLQAVIASLALEYLQWDLCLGKL